jgi:hypothetical protein
MNVYAYAEEKLPFPFFKVITIDHSLGFGQI